MLTSRAIGCIGGAIHAPLYAWCCCSSRKLNHSRGFPTSEVDASPSLNSQQLLDCELAQEAYIVTGDFLCGRLTIVSLSQPPAGAPRNRRVREKRKTPMLQKLIGNTRSDHPRGLPDGPTSLSFPGDASHSRQTTAFRSGDREPTAA
jgi:hypothetical protein